MWLTSLLRGGSGQAGWCLTCDVRPPPSPSSAAQKASPSGVRGAIPAEGWEAEAREAAFCRSQPQGTTWQASPTCRRQMPIHQPCGLAFASAPLGRESRRARGGRAFGAAHRPRQGSRPLGWPSVCLSGALFRPVSRARRKTGVLVRVPTCGRRSVVSSPGRCTALGNAAETWANPQQGGRTPAIPDRRDFNRRGRRGAAVT